MLFLRKTNVMHECTKGVYQMPIVVFQKETKCKDTWGTFVIYIRLHVCSVKGRRGERLILKNCFRTTCHKYFYWQHNFIADHKCFSLKPFLSMIHLQNCISDIKPSRDMKIPLRIFCPKFRHFYFLTKFHNLTNLMALTSNMTLVYWKSSPKVPK